MLDFVGRKAELRVLERAFRSRESSLIPIYGRRRVGKSELILRFLKNKTAVYFAGKKARAELQMREFLKESSVALKQPLLAGFSTIQWKDILNAVVDQWKSDKKLIIVFDEFQWTVEASPELPSILQELWDRKWKKSGNVMLILCGSYIGFMEREILGKKSPLFGRRTAQIHLKPFPCSEAALFHPQYSIVDKARSYFICGGIPLYLRYFSDDRSLEMNICDNLLSPFAPLFQEPEFLLREELREVENYYAILLAVSSGSHLHRDISSHTNIESRKLHYYLNQLIQLGYLKRHYPLTGKKPNQRDVRYILEDPLLRFWFRFIYPNISYITQRGAEKALRDRIKSKLDSYFGVCFERLCREALPAVYRKEGVNAGFELGEFWNRETQIDVVGLREDNVTDLCECKWGKIRSFPAAAKELEKKVALFPNDRGATIVRRIFSRYESPRKSSIPEKLRWHSLNDLYK